MQLPPKVNALRSMVESMRVEGKDEEAFEMLVTALAMSETKVAELQLLLKKLKASSRGATSEQVTPEQMSLLSALLASVTPEDAEPNVEEELQADEALTAELEQAEADAAAGNDSPAPKRTRNAVIRLDTLKVEHTHLPVPDDKADWEVIGEEIVSRLRYHTAYFYREDIHVPVLRDPASTPEATSIVKVTDGIPLTLIPGSIVAADALAAVVVAKYERHMPLHRFHRAVLADQDVDLPVSTLCDWVAAAGDACRRLSQVLLEKVTSSWLVRTDSTGMKVLDSGPDRIHRGTFWCYLGESEDPDKPPNIVFLYTPTGEGEAGPWKILAGRTGYVQADASNLYDRVFNGLVGTATELGCNSHALRSFKELLPDEPLAAYPVQLMQRVYRLEKLADTQGLSRDQRTAMRQERSRPIMEDKLLPYLQRLTEQNNPTAPITQAAQYTINHWTALTCFLDDGRLPLDNNDVERTLRPIRLGEKNYLFAGSDDAAERTAAILSILATAKAHGLKPHEYLTDVFARLARPLTRAGIEELLPAAWAASRQQK